MNDNLELAKRVWADILMIDICLVLPAEAIPIITTALEARYKAGVEAMRDAAFEPFSSHEYVGRMTLWHHLQNAARLLEAK